MGFGMGHNLTAKTLQKKYKEQSNVEAEVIDLLDLVPPFLRPFQSGYHHMLNRFPVFYHCLFDWTDQSRIFRHCCTFGISKLGLFIRKQLNTRIEEFQPTRIVSTHPFSLLLLSSKWLSLPTVGIVTDYVIHPTWTSRPPDILCVSKGLLHRKQIQRLKCATNLQFCETGFPIDPEFYQFQSKEQAKSRLILDDRPVVLVMGGGTGLGPIEEIVTELESVSQLQVVVLTGTNLDLYKRLKERIHAPHIRIEGFRSDVALWMSASDLLITKSGGVTINEAIAKRLPMFLFEAFRGQEQANQQYLIHYGLAVVTHPHTICTQVEDFFAHQRYQGIRDFFYVLQTPDAVDRIIERTLSI